MRLSISRYLSVFLLFLTLTLGLSHRALAYTTRNVIVITIDGLRNTEALKYRFNPGEVTHPYIPRIWGELRPQGTAFTNFKNVFATYTTPGHYNIITGRWHWAPNTERWMNARPETPTIFEYARKGLGLTQRETWAVVGKGSLNMINYSIYPGYGIDYAAKLAITGPDDQTYQKALSVLDTDHPRLLFINFEDVDLSGHSGDWNNYVNTIRTADNYVAELWNHIQTDPFYKDNTTLIITTDHGRHDNAHGGFQNHTGMCDGDRDIMLLILGPDSPANMQVSTQYYHVDIAPTIGELMGFETPFAEGNSIVDFFNYSGTFDVHLRDLRTASYEGKAYKVWRDNSSGVYEVYFSMYDDATRSWSPSLQLSASGVMTKFSDISVNKDGLHVIWIDLKGGLWSLKYRNSPDFGQTWDSEHIVAKSVIETASTKPAWVYEPIVVSDSRGKAILYTEEFGAIKAKYAYHVNAKRQKEVIAEGISFPAGISAEYLGQGLVMAYQRLVRHGVAGDWDVYIMSRPSKSALWGAPVDIGDDRAQSITPFVTVFKSEPYLFFVDNRKGPWEIFMSKSVDGGLTWSVPVHPTLSGVNAWYPTAAGDANFLYLAWVDYRDGHGEVYYMKYDGAVWTSPVKLSNAINSKVLNPRVLVLNGNRRFVSWVEISPQGESVVHHSIP